MNVPEVINLKFVEFPAYYLAIFVLGLITLFVIWFESIKDGFDKEKVFDMFFLSTIYLVGLFFLIDYTSFYNYYIEQNQSIILVSSFVVGTLVLYKYVTKKWKWSVYRFLDIFSFLYFAFAIFILFGQAYLSGEMSAYIYLGFYTSLYLLFYYTRNLTFSGLAFSAFLILTSVVGLLFYKDEVYLIFYLALITISIVNLVIRSKTKMTKNKFNFDFIAKIKGTLLSKEKRLKDEQQKLIEEDPYLQEGRDTDNAENIDEAILEDRAKEEIEIKKENIENMQDQVDKALDKIEEGNYGFCETCGAEIDKARLEAYPEATKCLKCSNLEGENS